MPVDNLIPNMQFTPIYQRYIGNALQEEKALMDRVETKAASVDAYYDQIDAATKAAQAAPFSNDQAYLVKAKQEAAAALKMAHERGDYENLGKHAKLAASEFQKYYVPVAQNHKALQEFITDSLKDKNDWTPLQKQGWISLQKKEYEKKGGLQIDPVTGNATNFFSGAALDKYEDYGKLAIELADKIKDSDIKVDNGTGNVQQITLPNGEVIPYSYIMSTYGSKGVKKERVQQVIQNYLENNSKYQYQTHIEASIDAELRGDTEVADFILKQPKEVLDTLTKNLTKQGKDVQTPKDLYLELYKQGKKLGLINASIASAAHELTDSKVHIIHDNFNSNLALEDYKKKKEKEELTSIGAEGSTEIPLDLESLNNNEKSFQGNYKQAVSAMNSAATSLQNILKGTNLPLAANIYSLEREDFVKLFTKNGKVDENKVNEAVVAHDNYKKALDTKDNAQSELINIKAQKEDFEKSIDKTKLISGNSPIDKSFPSFYGSGDILKSTGLVSSDGKYDINKLLDFNTYLKYKVAEASAQGHGIYYDKLGNKRAASFTNNSIQSFKQDHAKLLSNIYNKQNKIIGGTSNEAYNLTSTNDKGHIGRTNKLLLENISNNNWQTYTFNGIAAPVMIKEYGMKAPNGEQIKGDDIDVGSLVPVDAKVSNIANKITVTFKGKAKVNGKMVETLLTTRMDANNQNGLHNVVTDGIEDYLLNATTDEALKGGNFDQTTNIAFQTYGAYKIPAIQQFNPLSPKPIITYKSPTSTNTYILEKTKDGSKWNFIIDNGVNKYTKNSIYIENTPQSLAKAKSDLEKLVGTYELGNSKLNKNRVN